MKQHLLKTWLMLLCLLTGVGTTWAAEVTYTFSDVASEQSWSNAVAYTNVELGLFTFSVTGGGNNGKYYTTDTTWRFYAGGGLQITPVSGYTITSVTTNPAQKFSVSYGVASTSFSGTVKIKSITINYTTSGGPTPTTYTVTIADDVANGSVTADPTSAEEGATITLTATPATGYELDAWSVTNASTSESITVTDNKFTMPAANVTVSATFKKTEEPSGDEFTYYFADMTDFSSWGTAYGKKTTTFSDGAYAELASANKNTTNVTDCPVTKGGDVIFKAPSGKKIVSLTFTCTQWTTKAQTITLNTSSDGTSFTKTSTTSSNFVLSASDLTDVTAVKFTFSSTSNQVGINSIKVTYSDGGDPSGDPEIPNFIKTATLELKTNADPYDVRNLLNIPEDYDQNTYNITTTINDLTQKDGEFSCVYPSLSFQKAGSYTVKVTAAAMPGKYAETTGTIEVTVTDDTPIVPLTTMDEIFAAATAAGSTATNATITFNNWVVSGVKNSNAYLTDNAGKGLIIYASGHGFEVGDILSGTVACKVQLYRASAEITTLTSTTEGLTVTKGGEATPVTTIDLANLSGVNTGAVLSYENLQYNGTAFTDGETTITPYTTFITLPTLVSGKNYNVTGVYIQFNTTKEIAPRSEADIELIKPTVTLVSVAVSGTPKKTEYYDGDAFKTAGLVVTATYTDDSQEEITEGITWAVTPETLTVGTTSVVVTATVEGITSPEYIVDGLTVTVAPSKVTWNLSINETTTASEDEMSWVADEASMQTVRAKGATAANNYYPGKDSKTSTRFYARNALLFTPAFGITITSIVYEATTSSYATALANSTWANATASANGTTVTITPTDGTKVVSAVIGATTGATSVMLFYTGTVENKVLPLVATDGEDYFATFSSDRDVQFTDHTTTVYVVTASEGSKIQLTEVENKKVPANTGVLIKCSETHSAYKASAAPAITAENMLYPASKDKGDLTDHKFYMLAYATSEKDKLGFYWGASDGGVFDSREGSAYLAVPASMAPVKGFSFRDLETGIEKVNESNLENGEVYNLQGQRVNANAKGIIIKNGKKYFVK